MMNSHNIFKHPFWFWSNQIRPQPVINRMLHIVENNSNQRELKRTQIQHLTSRCFFYILMLILVTIQHLVLMKFYSSVAIIILFKNITMHTIIIRENLSNDIYSAFNIKRLKTNKIFRKFIQHSAISIQHSAKATKTILKWIPVRSIGGRGYHWKWGSMCLCKYSETTKAYRK